VRTIERAGGEVFDGMESKGIDCDEHGCVIAVWTEAASRQKAHRASEYVLATGGIMGGGLIMDYAGRPREEVFSLPINIPGKRSDWLNQEFLSPSGHPIFRAGISINANFQPIENSVKVLHENLYAVGSLLGNGEYIRERSFDGVNLTTGYIVGSCL